MSTMVEDEGDGSILSMSCCSGSSKSFDARQMWELKSCWFWRDAVERDAVEDFRSSACLNASLFRSFCSITTVTVDSTSRIRLPYSRNSRSASEMPPNALRRPSSIDSLVGCRCRRSRSSSAFSASQCNSDTATSKKPMARRLFGIWIVWVGEGEQFLSCRHTNK